MVLDSAEMYRRHWRAWVSGLCMHCNVSFMFVNDNFCISLYWMLVLYYKAIFESRPLWRQHSTDGSSTVSSWWKILRSRSTSSSPSCQLFHVPIFSFAQYFVMIHIYHFDISCWQNFIMTDWISPYTVFVQHYFFFRVALFVPRLQKSRPICR